MATGRMGVTWALMGHCLLSYFESIVDLLVAAEGRDWTQWSSGTTRFGYQVRNAVAHSGQVHFNNPKALSVSWRGIKYSPNQNGQKVFDDIATVEFILLMEEIDRSGSI